MIYLTDSQIVQTLNNQPNLILDAILEALVMQDAGHVQQSKNSLRKSEYSPASDRLTSMMGFIGIPPRVVGFKLIGSFSGNSQVGLPRSSVLIVLCDPETHIPRYILDGTSISLQRTAEMTVFGIQLLQPNSKK